MKKQLTKEDHIELSKKFNQLQDLYNEINEKLTEHFEISDPILAKFKNEASFNGRNKRRSIKYQLDLLWQRVVSREEIKKDGTCYFIKYDGTVNK